MIVSKTPYRISLFGGGSDHQDWFHQEGGRVISFSIDKFCYLTVRTLPPFFPHKYRLVYSKVEEVSELEKINHPALRECLRKYAPDQGLEIHHDGDLPAQSGVGSSSAFVVGLIHSLLARAEKLPTRDELANKAIEMEHVILKENVGWQDQIACALGGINVLEFGPGPHWEKKPISLTTKQTSEINSRMALVYTGIKRFSSDISASLLENLPRKRAQMQKIMQFASSCAQIFERQEDLEQIGGWLNESWHLKKEVNPYSSSMALDEFYERGLKCGALGGKILGAGGGGFMLFWLKKDGLEEFSSRFRPGVIVPVRISKVGSEIIFKENGVSDA